MVVTNPDGASFMLTRGFRFHGSAGPTDDDAGSPQPTVDAGSPHAGSPDAGVPQSSGGATGCGCSETNPSSLATFALLGLGALVSRRRRRS